MAHFVSGLELARRHYESVLAPGLAGQVHSAARLGNGSEVLGFDTERSMDHDWEPSVLVFRSAGEVGAWFASYLGCNPLEGMGLLDWLSCSWQRLAGATAGAVFHDGLGAVEEARRRLAWYPDDVWRFALASQWLRLSQEEAFVGRTGEVGDELGSSVLGARLVRDVMRLAFLLERRWAPYGKWLGSAFAELALAGSLAPLLAEVQAASTWREREQPLAAAYEVVARAQNALGLAAAVDPTRRPYHSRPFVVLHAERFAAGVRSAISDAAVAALPLAGTVDQFLDSTDVLDHPDRCRRLAAVLYGIGVHDGS